MLRLRFQIVLVLVLFIKYSKCEFSDIVQLCEDGSCNVNKDEYEILSANSTDYNERLYKLISAGLPQIFWDEVKEKRDSFLNTGVDEFGVSAVCSLSLYQVAEGLDNADLWAYKSKFS